MGGGEILEACLLVGVVCANAVGLCDLQLGGSEVGSLSDESGELVQTL